MTTTRYFEVKVTGCNNCPEKYYDESYMAYGCGYNDVIGKEFKTFKQNQYAITPSCPMWNETKESDTK